MIYRLPALALAVCLLGSACKTTKPTPARSGSLSATITEEGLLNCFAPSLSLADKPVWCEASAVVFDGSTLLFANDKDMPPALSPVFAKTPATLADSTQSPTYLMPPAFPANHKYEDFAQTPDLPAGAGGTTAGPRRFVLLTTASTA